MKNTKICPKCKSDDIVRFDGYTGAYGSGNYVKVGITSVIDVNRYVCCSCGYTEEWIDMEDMDMIVKIRKARR